MTLGLVWRCWLLLLSSCVRIKCKRCRFVIFIAELCKEWLGSLECQIMQPVLELHSRIIIRMWFCIWLSSGCIFIVDGLSVHLIRLQLQVVEADVIVASNVQILVVCECDSFFLPEIKAWMMLRSFSWRSYKCCPVFSWNVDCWSYLNKLGLFWSCQEVPLGPIFKSISVQCCSEII